MNQKTFALSIVTFVFFLLFLSGFLHSLNLNYTNNDFLLSFQENKLHKLSDNAIDTIIVGDSAAGNAISADFLSTLTNKPNVNLSLNGSYGLVGSLNMIKKARSTHQEIKNVIIVQTPDLWRRPISLTSYFKTRSDSLSESSSIIKNIYLQYIAYLFNIKEIKWFIKHTVHKRKQPEIENDYPKQFSKKFSNAQKRLTPYDALSTDVHPQKTGVLSLLDDYCFNQKLNCILLHAPLHEALIKNNPDATRNINAKLTKHIKHINFVPSFYPIEEYKLGDSADHVDINFKEETTKMLYQKSLEYLK